MKEKIIEYGGFSLNMSRFEEVVLEMLPIFRENKNYYEDNFVFPEFRFKKYFHKVEYKEFLGELLFFAAYFDHNKKSAAHYKDVERLANLVESNRLVPLLKELGSQKNLEFENKFKLNESLRIRTKKNTLTSTLYNLETSEQITFVNKIMKSIALSDDKYIKKVLDGDRTNNNLIHVKEMLEIIVRDYDENPLNIVDGKTPKEIYKDLQKLPGVGPGLAYLTVLFYSESGLISYGLPELVGVEPKIDGNDIVVAKLTNVLKVNQTVNKTPIINALKNSMSSVAQSLNNAGENTSAIEIDLCFWVASQIYSLNLPIKYSSARNLFSKSDFLNHSSSKYYSAGTELPNHVKKKTSKKNDFIDYNSIGDLFSSAEFT